MSEPQLAWNDAVNGKFYENLQTALQSCQSRLSILESKFDALQSCYEQEKCKRQTLEQAVEEVKLKLDSTFKASEGTAQEDNAQTNTLAQHDGQESITDVLRKTAEDALQNTGYVYDERTKLYYDQKSGFYYDPVQALYYHSQTGIYYRFDSEKNTYVFHSQVDLATLYAQYGTAQSGNSDGKAKKSRKKREKLRSAKTQKSTSENKNNEGANSGTLSSEHSDLLQDMTLASPEDDGDEETIADEKSDGECSTSESDASECDGEIIDSVVSHEYVPYTAPSTRCIRAMVISSETLTLGSLYIVTCNGLTIGREVTGANVLCIPDELASREHCTISYNEALQKYFVLDRNSQNGTFVNEQRIPEGGECAINHGDILRVVNTQLQLHIHPGQMTCGDCEPGEVQARLLAAQRLTADVTEAPKSPATKEADRRKTLKNIRRKYGLEKAPYEASAQQLASGDGGSKYSDRARQRRREKGVDAPDRPDDAPASVNRAISADNVGHKLMSRMGWKTGQALGKSQQGITEPIQVALRSAPSAGLGTGSSRPIDDTVGWQRAQKWAKAQERYSKIGNAQPTSNADEAVPLAAAATASASSTRKISTNTSRLINIKWMKTTNNDLDIDPTIRQEFASDISDDASNT